MFCRYCGSHIPDDSLFCAKCGKRLGPRENPRLAKIVQRLRLKTPYPYFALLFTLFIAWTIISRPTHADYSHLKWSFEVDKKLDLPQESLFAQALSLVVENTGAVAVREIPIELSARIEPPKRADVEADFLGRKLMVFAAILIALVLFLVLPVAGSFLITNSHFHFPERGPTTPEAVGISVLPAEFVSQDGIPLRGWWIPGDRSMPVIIFVHGLNRS